MIVQVCDAICGSGKTESCINLINQDTSNNKYIFVTPYLTEVERIKRSCPSRNFVSPGRKFTTGYSKLRDIVDLIRAGENIASTHALFSCYTNEIKELIRTQNYILILDEVIDLFQPVGLDGGDVDFLMRNKIANHNEDNSVLWTDDSYSGVAFSEVKKISQSRQMIDYDGSFYFWSLSIDVFNCFSEVYVLTYLFKYQLLRYFFDIHHVNYRLIGTTHQDGKYSFCDLEDMDRRMDLRKLVHIVEDPRLNYIGKESFSLSAGWFERAIAAEGQPQIQELKNNLYTFLRKTNKPNDRMWTTLNRFKRFLKGKGYSNSFLTFNKRATNEFANRHICAYCVNVYMMPWMRNYLMRVGASDVNQDMYALSVLIQWVFRSAVRKGEEIWLYIPSARMRIIFQTWLDNLAQGRDLDEIIYTRKKFAKKPRLVGIELNEATKKIKEKKQ